MAWELIGGIIFGIFFGVGAGVIYLFIKNKRFRKIIQSDEVLDMLYKDKKEVNVVKDARERRARKIQDRELRRTIDEGEREGSDNKPRPIKRGEQIPEHGIGGSERPDAEHRNETEVGGTRGERFSSPKYSKRNKFFLR